MANGRERIDIDVGLKVNQNSLTELKSSLQAIQQEAAKASGTGKMTKELENSAQAAKKLEKILDSSWNSKLQQFNLNKVNKEVKTAYGSVNQLKTALEGSGNVGAAAYNKVASALLTTNMQLKQSNKLLDSMAISMANTVKWGITSSIFNNMTRSIQQAWSYTRHLDSSLNDIRIVTGQSAEQMDKFAKSANKAAKELGASTLDYTEASLIYYQQGLDEKEVAARAETTLKAANVTGQSGEEVSEQLTAVWNGYKVSAEEAELYVDKLAAVAAETAADLEELSVGMSKVASAASLMGVPIDSLNAQMATIVSVTRQAPESVGTALKTIYARMGDIEAGLDGETSLGHYTAEMKEMGINVLDSSGKLRDMGEVVEEVGGKWQGMTREQQIALSQTMAGTRQYNNLLALFDNWDMYTDALNTSANAAGTLQKQQDIYMESTAAHLQELRTETQRTYDLMFNTDSINGMIDGVDSVVEHFNNFIEGIDGGGHALLLFGSIAANIFDKQLAGSLLKLQNNLQTLKFQIKDAVNTLQGKTNANNAKQEWINTQAAAQVNLNNAVSGTNVGDAGLKAQQQAASEILRVQKGLTQEQYQQSLEINKKIGLETQRLAQLEKEGDITDEIRNGLALMNADESMSNSSIEVRVNNRKEALNILEEEKRALIELKFLEAEVANKQKTGTDAVKEALIYEEQYKAILGTIKTDDAEIDASWERVLKSIKEGNFSLNQFKNMIDQIEREELEVNAAIKAGNDLLRARSPQRKKEEEDARKNVKIYRDQNTAIASQGETNLKMQKFVNIGMAAIGTISSLTGAVSVLGDETADTEQKIHAVGSAFSGVAMAIGSAFGPAGMVIGGIIGALGSLVSQLDFVEDAFKSTQERMQELQEEQSKIISQTNQFNSSKKALQNIAEEYQNLSNKAGDYDKNIENLTTEEVERYNELKNTILEYNPEALLAYDSEGNAILKKNELIQETINLLKEQYDLETKEARKENLEERKQLKEKAYNEAKENVAKKEEDYFSEEASYYNRMNSEGASNKLKGSIDSTLSNLEEDDLNYSLLEDFYKVLESYEGKDNEIAIEAIDDFIQSVEKSNLENSEILLNDAKILKENIKTDNDKIAQYSDELAKAKVELQNAEKIDPSIITESIQLNDPNWEKLDNLNLDIDLNSLLAEYADSLDWEIGKEGDYNPLIQKAQDYMAAVQEAINNLGVEGFNTLVTDAQELNVEDFSSIDEYNEALKNKINEIINNNKAFFEDIAPEYKQYIFEMLFGMSGFQFDENGLVTEINEQKQKVSDAAVQGNDAFDWQNVKGGVLTTNIIENVMTPEQLDNFDQILGMIDEGTLATKGWRAALEEACAEFDKLNAIEKSNQELKSAAEDYDLDEDELKAYRDLLASENEELADNAELLADASIAAKRYQKGVKSLADGWDDYNKVMSDSEASIEDVSKVLPDVNDALKDMLDYSDEEFEMLPDDFAQKNWDKISDVVDGVEGAYEDLLALAGQEIVFNMGLAPNVETDLVNAINGITEAIDVKDLEVGATLDDTGYTDALNDMLLKGSITVDQLNAALQGVQFDPDVSEKTLTMEDMAQMSSNDTITVTDDEGNTHVLSVSDARAQVTNGSTFTIPILNGKSTTYKGPSVSARAGGSGGKKSGGGGGGGGGGSSSKPKTEKKIESKKDRYHDVNVRLSQIDDQLEDIGRDQEKLFGKDLIDSLNEELDILEKQRDTLKEKLDIARQEQAELQHTLRQSGVQFNEDGTIANYLSIIEQKEAEYNALVDQYNSLAAGDAQDNFKETVLDPAKENLDKLYEDIQAYDDLILDTIPEIENGLDDISDREVEIKVQKLNMEMELRLDLSEAQKDWNEFKREVIDDVDDDDVLGNALADKDLFENLISNGSLEAGTRELQTIMDEINEMNETGSSDDIFGENKQKSLEELKASMEDLMGVMKDLDELQEQMAEHYLESIDNVIDAYEEQADSYEYVNDLIEHNLNLIELIHGDDAYAEMAKTYEQMEKNNLDIVASYKAAADYYKQMMEQETDPEAREKWEEAWKDSIANLNDAVETSVENIVDKYKNTINVIFDELNDKITNGKGLDYVNLEWELSNENQDAYLDAINSEYELQQLERKYRDSIDSADSISAQRSLNKLMDEELKKLREKDKLTQYDIDRANAKYELRLKEIALEEAQQNKTQMRLRRDSSGNYSYQFVADQDSVSAAQQEVDEARNSLYNMDKDAYRENQQAILDTWNEFQEKMRDSANMSAEERALIEQQYNERINNLLGENNAIRVNLNESAFMEMEAMYDNDEIAFQEMTAAEQEILMNQMVPNWNNSVQEMVNTFVGEGGFLPTCEQAFLDLDQATIDYNTSLEILETTAGVSFGAISEGYNTNIELAKDLAAQQQEIINKTIEEKDATEELKGIVDDLANSYKAVGENAKNALIEAQKLLEWEQKKAAEEAAAEEQRRKEQEQQQNPGGGSGGNPGGGGAGSGNGTALTSDIIDGVAGAIYYWTPAAWGTGNDRKQKIESKFGAGSYSQIQGYINQHVDLAGNLKQQFKYGWGDRDKYKNYYYSKFDTGGYTGDWIGEDGKLAMLHQKELVLNADDTQHILTAVSMVRDMNSMFTALNDSILSRVTGMTQSLTPQAQFEATQGELNQNVNIQASFPGVSSKAEIEQAFANLVSMASQHAYNTQR